MMLIDRYVIFARFLPAVVVVLPALALTTWVPLSSDWAKWLTGMGGFAFLVYVVSHASRERGRRIETALWESWGGAPSRQMLRHRDPTFDPVTKARYHSRLVALQAVPSMPTSEEEGQDPRAAENSYAAASQWLVNNTRDKKTFPLVFEENVGYGFRRNLLGMKTWGLISAGLGIVSAGIGLFLGRVPAIEMLGSALVALYLLVTITQTSVRTQANTYARRLIEALDNLKPAPRAAATKASPKARSTSSRQI
jgi:hypothetical protein